MKTYNYKNHLIWKYDNLDYYIVEAIDGNFKSLKQCKTIINKTD